MVTEEQLKLVKEVCAEAEKTSRLSDWETGFIDNLRSRALQYGQSLNLSERQWDAFKKIEQKLFAV